MPLLFAFHPYVIPSSLTPETVAQVGRGERCIWPGCRRI